MRVLLAAAGLVGVLTAGAPAQQAVTFTPYAHKKGDVTRTTKTEDSTSVTTITAMGKEQKKDEKKKKTVVYKTEVLHVGSDATKPEKVRRTYETAVEVNNGAETSLPLDGLAVVVERADGKYAFLAADGTKLPEKAAAELDKEFNKKGSVDDRDLFPKGGMKVGDTWDLTEKFLKAMDGPDSPFAIDPAKAKVTGKLLSVAKKDGATVGDIAVTANLPLTGFRGKTPIQLMPGSTWTIDMKGSGAFDGSSPAGGIAGTMKIAMTGTVQGVGLKVDADIKQSSKTERVTGAKR